MTYSSEILSDLRVVTVDIDGLLYLSHEIVPGEEMNTWFELTYELYLFFGWNEDQARYAVSLHRDAFKKFSERKRELRNDLAAGKLSKATFDSLLIMAYEAMASDISQLLIRAGKGAPITKKIVDTVVDKIIQRKVVTSKANELIKFLKVFQNVTSIPVVVLTGGFFPMAAGINKLGFQGAEANSIFIFGNGDSKTPYDEIDDGEVFTGFHFDHLTPDNKLKKLFSIVQRLRDPHGEAIDPETQTLSLFDGDSSDRYIAGQSRSIALNPKDPDVIEKVISVTSHHEMIEAFLSLLPEELSSRVRQGLAA